MNLSSHLQLALNQSRSHELVLYYRVLHSKELNNPQSIAIVYVNLSSHLQLALNQSRSHELVLYYRVLHSKELNNPQSSYSLCEFELSLQLLTNQGHMN